MNKNNSWSDEIQTVASIAVPMVLVLLGLFTPKETVTQDQKDILLTAGIALFAPAGVGFARKKTEINQEVQTQELNVAPSTDNYMQYNPPARHPEASNSRQYQEPYLSQIAPEDEEFVESREVIASSPYRVVSPDELED